MLNVSVDSIQRARKVQETAPRENMEHGGNRQDANLHLEPPITRAEVDGHLVCALAGFEPDYLRRKLVERG